MAYKTGCNVSGKRKQRHNKEKVKLPGKTATLKTVFKEEKYCTKEMHRMPTKH